MADYYIANNATTGTRTTGASTADDWSASNLYNEFDDAYEYWFANDSGNAPTFVFDDGTYTSDTGPFRVRLEKVTSVQGTIKSRSGSTTHDMVEENANAMEIAPASASSGYILDGISFKLSNGGQGAQELIWKFQTNAGPMTVQDCDVSNNTWNAGAYAVGIGRMLQANNTSAMQFTRFTVDGNTVNSSEDASFANFNSGPVTCDDLVITDNTLSTSTFGGAMLYFAGSDLTVNGGTFTGNTFEQNDNTARYGLIRNSGIGTITIDGATVTGNQYTGTGAASCSQRGAFFADAAGGSSAADHVITNSVFSNNTCTDFDNQRGGLALAIDDGSRVSLTDCEAHDNIGWYGCLAYCGAGGGLDLERVKASGNTAVTTPSFGETASPVYFGGGAADCSLKAALLIDNVSAQNGVALYIHNSDTPATPGTRTVTVEHLTTAGNSGGGNVVQINGTTHAMTVNFINCAFGEVAPIVTGGTDTLLTLNFTNCAARDTFANLLSGSGATINESGTVVVADGPVNADGTPKAELLNAGSNTATTLADVNGDAYDTDEPHIGAFAIAGGSDNFIAVKRRVLNGPPKKRIYPKTRRGSLRGL